MGICTTQVVRYSRALPYQVQPKSVPSASARRESTVVSPSKQDAQEPEGIPVEELEAKLLSVRKALERFDDVKVWSRVP